MAKDCRPDRPTDKPDEKDPEGLEHTDDWIGFGEKQLTEDKPGYRPVEQEIILFDRGADRAGDHRSTQLPAMLRL